MIKVSKTWLKEGRRKWLKYYHDVGGANEGAFAGEYALAVVDMIDKILRLEYDRKVELFDRY